jgi:peptide/nickel transport system substrate-binding protein
VWRWLLAIAVAGCTAGPGGRDTVVIASGADLESANPLVTVHPLARQVQRYALFVTLARYDSALAPVPYYARAWTWSPDRRSLRLVLDPSLRWHDGVPTTARDVAFTLDAARDPATGFPRAAELTGLRSVEAPDDTTVVLAFDRPLAAFPSILCELPILPAHRLAAVARSAFRRDSFATAPVGNGPFRFVERRAGQRWVFQRNPDFPQAMGGPPAVRRLVVAVVDEPTTKFAGLVSGELDLAGISPTMADLVTRDPHLRLITYPVFFATGVVFNAARSPFDDLRVRRAVNGAINRERIVQVALAGYAAPADGPVPPEHPFAVVERGADPVNVDSLLDAAGWLRQAGGLRSRGGVPFRFTLLTVGSGDNAVEQLIQGDLRQRGIDMEIRQLELGAFLAEARASPKRFDALITGVAGDLALSHLAAMFDGTQRGGALDYGGYHTATLDSLFAAARDATEPAAVAAAWRRLQEQLEASLPVAWLYHSRGVQGASRRLQGVRMDLRGELVTVGAWHLGPSPARAASP